MIFLAELAFKSDRLLGFGIALPFLDDIALSFFGGDDAELGSDKICTVHEHRPNLFSVPGSETD